MKVSIDSGSGFCGGVIRAIRNAESILDRGEKLRSLGEIVHNEEELARLERKGLVTIGKDELTASGDGGKLLIRAHGEPPAVYDRARELGYEIVDCTCPVVLNIQKQIRNSEGRVLLFGKHGHPEVLGLVGQKPDTLVFDSIAQLTEILPTLNGTGKVEVFSQTTMSPTEYRKACALISAALPGAVTHDTICRQVASRHKDLSAFAAEHDVIVFVSGSASSNGKVLFELCKSVNPRSYNVGAAGQIRPEWFRKDDSVGVSGATSTPGWLLQEVAGAIENLQ